MTQDSPSSEAADQNAGFLRVTEIFHSIQGESTWAGKPCTFIRLTGCPLRCTWCDTEYAFTGGERMTFDQIMDSVRATGCDLVELTGGEPLAHKGAFELAQRLVDEGFTLLIETSGAFSLAGLPPEAHVIMDLKCPGSGEVERNLWSNLELLGSRDEVKFVVADRTDYEWMVDAIQAHNLATRVNDGSLAALLVSPVWEIATDGSHGPRDTGGNAFLADISSWILADGLPVRLQLQVHKLIWGPNVAGV